MLPTAVGLCKHGFAVLLHLCDKRARCCGIFVLRGPDEKFKQHRSKRDALRCKAVVDAAAVLRRRLGGDDVGSLQSTKAISQDAGRYALARPLKLAKRPIAPHHQVADDKQRPAISEEVQRDADRTSGAALRSGVIEHGDTLRNITFTLQAFFVASFSQPTCLCSEGGPDVKPSKTVTTPALTATAYLPLTAITSTSSSAHEAASAAT